MLILALLISTLTNAATLTYENDSSGNAVSGYLSDLKTAALDGKKIKVKITDADGHTEMFSFDRVIVGTNDHVYGECALRMANFSLTGNNPSFSYYSNPGVAIFGTHGKETVKVNTNTYINPLAMKWYVE